MSKLLGAVSKGVKQLYTPHGKFNLLRPITTGFKQQVSNLAELRARMAGTTVLFRSASGETGYQTSYGIYSADCLPAYWRGNFSSPLEANGTIAITSYTACPVTVTAFSLFGTRPIIIVDQRYLMGIVPYATPEYPEEDQHIEVEVSVIGTIPKEAVIGSMSFWGGFKPNPDYQAIDKPIPTPASCHKLAEELIAEVKAMEADRASLRS